MYSVLALSHISRRLAQYRSSGIWRFGALKQSPGSNSEPVIFDFRTVRILRVQETARDCGGLGTMLYPARMRADS